MQVQANSPVLPSASGATSTRNQTENLPKSEETRTKPVPPPQAEPSQKDVESATKKLQGFVDSVRSDIQFSMDQDSGRTVVKVVDKQTKDVLMQFPSEEALGLAKSIDRLQGLLIKQKA